MNIPEGWPTEEMITAGNRAYWWEHDGAASDVESYDRKMRRAFLAMLAAAPKPPAQDEPVGWINRVELFGTHVSVCLSDAGENLPDETPLYTHPADDKLRKAAEELLFAYDNECGDMTGPIGTGFETLRAALEGK